MKKGNIVLLAAGYLAGLAIALRFNKRAHEDHKSPVPSPEKNKTFGENVLDVHKNLFETLEASLLSDENKRRVIEYKQKFITELELFEKEAEVKMEEWKLKSMDKKDEVEAELRDLYSRRAEIMERARERGMEFADDAKHSGKDMMDHGKEMANRIFEDSKRKLDKWYEAAKRKLGINK